MTTTPGSSEQRVVLHNINWDLYERLLCAHQDRAAPRFTYDRGDLEIVSSSSEHEEITDTVSLLVNVVAEELGINVKGFGSTTFPLRDQERGFEPDACFYIQNVDRIFGKKKLDLSTSPPPDLAIEIDITSSSLNKLVIMAEAGVNEIWRFDETGWKILGLQKGRYKERKSSIGLPVLTAKDITLLIEESRTLQPLAWIRYVREWVRTRITA